MVVLIPSSYEDHENKSIFPQLDDNYYSHFRMRKLRHAQALIGINDRILTLTPAQALNNYTICPVFKGNNAWAYPVLFCGIS